MFARVAAQTSRVAASQGARAFGGLTFNPKGYSKTFIAGTIISVIVGGVGATKFAVWHQQRKHGFDKNKVGFTL